MKDSKLFHMLMTNLIIYSLKISKFNILLSPRPNIFNFIIFFVRQQESLNKQLESPKISPFFNIIFVQGTAEHLQKTKRVEHSMVPTQIRRILLVTLSLIYMVLFMIKMCNCLSQLELMSQQFRSRRYGLNQSIYQLINYF